MGMFDYVNFEMDCPKCGALVGAFQSKSAGCNMDLLDPDCVADMYSSCPKCERWIELSRRNFQELDPRDTPFTLDEVKAMGFRLFVEGRE